MEIDFTKGIIDLQKIKQIGADTIINFLSSIPEEKIVILDKEAGDIINNFIKPSRFQKEFNVTDMYYSSKKIPQHIGKYYIYFLLPTLKSIAFMNDVKFKDLLISQQNKHIVCFIRNRDNIVENSLHRNYVWDYFDDVEKLELLMYPVEYDCINMNIKNSLRIFTEQDNKIRRHIRKCIEQIQRTYGKIPEIVAYGVIATEIKKLIELDNSINKYDNNYNNYNNNEINIDSDEQNRSCSRSNSRPNNDQNTSHIHKLILIDRMVDTITPCLSQLTYEGAIDDLIGINNGCVKIEKELIPLNSGCVYYRDVRDRYISVTKQLLQSHVNCCIEPYLEKYDSTELDTKTIGFLTDVAKDKNFQRRYLDKHAQLYGIMSEIVASEFYQKTINTEQLALTVNASDSFIDNVILDKKGQVDEAELEILDFIDKAIENKKPLYVILPCLSLYLQIYGFNMSIEGYNNLISIIMDVYPNCYPMISRLEKLGLMNKKDIYIEKHTNDDKNKSEDKNKDKNNDKNKDKNKDKININDELDIYTFNKACKKLNLIKKIDTNSLEPTDISYIYGGYAPISGRIIEKELNKNNSRSTSISRPHSSSRAPSNSRSTSRSVSRSVSASAVSKIPISSIPSKSPIPSIITSTKPQSQSQQTQSNFNFNFGSTITSAMNSISNAIDSARGSSPSLSSTIPAISSPTTITTSLSSPTIITPSLSSPTTNTTLPTSPTSPTILPLASSTELNEYIPSFTSVIPTSSLDMTLVCFIGGCNYSEISACRIIGNIIVLTTEIFNKTSFFCPDL